MEREWCSQIEEFVKSREKGSHTQVGGTIQ